MGPDDVLWPVVDVLYGEHGLILAGVVVIFFLAILAVAYFSGRGK